MATTLPLSHPNDEKEGFFPRNHSSSSMNSIVGNHHHNHTDTCMPLMGEERIEMADPKASETECKEVRVTSGISASFSTPWEQLLAGSSPWCPCLGPLIGDLVLARAVLLWITGVLEIRSLHDDFRT